MARFNDNQQTINFNKISIGLSSPETILAESRGEVLKPETINYRTHKPERVMVCFVSVFLVLSRILNVLVENTSEFVIKELCCDRCGVEVTEKKVRRDRVGHIKFNCTCCTHLVFPFTYPTRLVTF